MLKVLNKLAFDALHKDREQFLVRDGMDMALCNYDPIKRVLEYAGANAPLYVVRGDEMLQFSPDKRPIGSYELAGHRFTDHRIKLEEGDMVYLFSDGYADQFGGPKGKKFLYRRFRELLVEISKFPAEQQRRMLDEAFQSWRKGHEQVDDILVMGMRA